MGDDRGVCADESSRSSSIHSASCADHLVVMVHGILGSKANWKFATETFVRALPDKVIVHCSECNMHTLSLDGIDVMGKRLAEEVDEVVSRRPGFRKISFISHSAGGLVARYAIGRLYRHHRRKSQEDPSRDTKDETMEVSICGLKAMNFVTIATPHLGSRGHKQVPFLFGSTTMEKLASCVIHLIFKRTGRHLFLNDTDNGEPPLLLRMVDDCGDFKFMSALRAFERRVAYSNVCYDQIVGWRTSSIRRNSELPKWEDSLCKKYPHVVYEEKHVVYEEKPEEGDAVNGEQYSTADTGYDMLEEELVTGLRRVSWERVDVSFHASRSRFAAHDVIQVKDSMVHSEGADVIQHIIDHFLA